MTPIRRALICGLGAIGQRHARNLRALLGDDLALHAWRRRGNRGVIDDALVHHPDRDVEQELRIVSHRSLPDALSVLPDVVVVCGPSAEHVATASAAVSVGAHIYVEKPLGSDWAGIEQLLRQVQMRGVVGMVGCQWRFHPLVRSLMEALKTGALGPLVRADAWYGEWLPGWHPYEDYRQSYAARADQGGGVVLTQIHDIDLLHWLLDGPPTRVIARGGSVSSLQLPVEDVVDALLDQPIAGGRSIPVHLTQNMIERPARRGLRLVGEAGRAELDLLAGRLTMDFPDHSEESRVPNGWARNDLFLQAMSAFIAAVAENGVSPIPLADGADVLRTALAIKHSLATGMAVDPATEIP